MAIGLILLLVAAILIFIYMFLHSTSISKNKIIIAFTVIGFAAGNHKLLIWYLFIKTDINRCRRLANNIKY